jgi:Transcriptional Coactivator p15 (PC4)
MKPIIVSRWPGGPGREVQVRIAEYRGRLVIDLRKWWDHDGTWRPLKGGLCLDIRHLAKLARGLKKARVKAKRKRLF